MAEKYPQFQPGDRVAYAASFLRNAGLHTTGMADRRGTYSKDHESHPSHCYVRWDDTQARIDSRKGDFAEADYREHVATHGELACRTNIAKVGSVRFADAGAR